MNKQWNIHKIEYDRAIKIDRLLIHTTPWMNFKCVILSVRRQIQKASYSDSSNKMFWNRQNYKKRKQIEGFQGLVIGISTDYNRRA